MFNRVIVPIDGSDFSWRAIGPASALAVQCDAVLEVLQIVTLPEDVPTAQKILREQLAVANLSPEQSAATELTVLVMGSSVAETISERVEQMVGSIIVMSSVGRGRSAALIGSIAEELLGSLFGPVMLVGPDAATGRADFRGNLIVPVDGSETSESALGLAAAWGIALEAAPWILLVGDPDAQVASDVAESSYPSRLAQDLSQKSNHRVEFEVLRDKHPAKAIADHARTIDAGLIIASTHGRTGLARIRAGSVAMGLVRHAPCPVVLNRPPHLAD
jgi:nucleotide-binding universal stress UspA family protein